MSKVRVGISALEKSDEEEADREKGVKTDGDIDDPALPFLVNHTHEEDGE